MNTTPAPNVPPTPQAITPGAAIPFPCWLHQSNKGWFYSRSSPQESWLELNCTHYLTAPADADPATFPKPDAVNNDDSSQPPSAASVSPTVLKGVLCRVGTPSEPDAITGYPRILISADEESIQQVKHLPLLKPVVVIEESEYLRLVSAALPSPASAAIAEPFRAFIGAPASAEAGDWADAAAREFIGEGSPHDADDQMWRQCDVDDLSAIIRKHAPQSQSKAEAVGAEQVDDLITVSPTTGARSYHRRYANGLFEAAAYKMEFPDHAKDTSLVAKAMEQFKWVERCFFSGALESADLSRLERALASLARPPATQNPPENAKGEAAFRLLQEAHDGLSAWTSGHAEESDKIVCSCCEKMRCGDDCDCNKLLNKISAFLTDRPQSTPSTREEGRT